MHQHPSVTTHARPALSGQHEEKKSRGPTLCLCCTCFTSRGLGLGQRVHGEGCSKHRSAKHIQKEGRAMRCLLEIGDIPLATSTGSVNIPEWKVMRESCSKILLMECTQQQQQQPRCSRVSLQSRCAALLLCSVHVTCCGGGPPQKTGDRLRAEPPRCFPAHSRS